MRRRTWASLARTNPLVALGMTALAGVAYAQSDVHAVILNGLPQQVIATYPEPGLGNYTPPPAGTIVGGSGGPSPISPPVSGDPSGPNGDSTDLSIMDQQSWGFQAAQNASSVGLNPNALAATCVIESGCQDVSGGSFTGAFQMGQAAFSDGLNAALAADPGLANQIVVGDSGRSDPTTEAIAAAGYQLLAVQALQSAGISSPTFLDTRGFYNFGPSGAALATASDSELMSQAMPGVSQEAFSKNGVSPDETVSQWKAAITAKVGNVATQPVLV